MDETHSSFSFDFCPHLLKIHMWKLGKHDCEHSIISDIMTKARAYVWQKCFLSVTSQANFCHGSCLNETLSWFLSDSCLNDTLSWFLPDSCLNETSSHFFSFPSQPNIVRFPVLFLFSSGLDGVCILYVCSGEPIICTPPHHSEVSPAFQTLPMLNRSREMYSPM